MSEQDNIKAATAVFEAWNSGDLKKAEVYQAEDFVSEGPGSPAPMDRDESLAYNQNFFNAFPDSKFKIVLTVAQGDYVVTNWTITGKHTGSMRSPSGATVPPTGKSATVTGSTTVQMRNGKAVRSWNYWDLAAMLGQLGLLPPM